MFFFFLVRESRLLHFELPCHHGDYPRFKPWEGVERLTPPLDSLPATACPFFNQSPGAKNLPKFAHVKLFFLLSNSGLFLHRSEPGS